MQDFLCFNTKENSILLISLLNYTLRFSCPLAQEEKSKEDLNEEEVVIIEPVKKR